MRELNLKSKTMCETKKTISSAVLKTVLEREKKTNGAVFTIKSLHTGKEFTYKIKRKLFGEKWFTFVLVETRYMEFRYLGSYFKGKLYKKGVTVITPSANAIGFILEQVEKGRIEWLDEKMEIYHTGSCLCCGKTLTDSESINRGIGPVCAGIV